ncbi:hypothetical protein KHM83_08910 [Fusibacter paucivorans]|uniref:Uncharacterized protein n=1 Tax=Fusibacter paucivorans TaxID=76009 RepID=A0ABS5PP28_9FIRM|nr:hypothetical protein [Fusibacter paucivorans]MBS7526796.1 hypothetical protein [Fusibacter paucivorans]
MQLKEIEITYEALYDFAMQAHNSAFVDEAKAQYITNEDGSDIAGFNEWFIFSYMPSNAQMTLADQYAKLRKTSHADAIAGSHRSVYEVAYDENGFLLKDIFTRDTYRLDGSQPLDTGLMSLRIIEMSEKVFFVGDVLYYDQAYKAIITKYILDQYNQHCTAYGPVDLKAFLTTQSMLIFKMSSIMSEIYEENSIDETYLLYQATYALSGSHDQLIDDLLSVDTITITADEDDEAILRVIQADRIFAELEFEGSFLYVLCNNEADRAFLQSLLKPFEDETFVFVKSEILTIDELL